MDLDMHVASLGSAGERALQRELGTTARAEKFYREQVLRYLNPEMIAFIGRQDMMFIATSDSKGECDASPRFGDEGMVVVIDRHTVAYPEYGGNGVMASLGNLRENPHIGIVMIDFQHKIGFHLNGMVKLLTQEQLAALHPDLPIAQPTVGKNPTFWVMVEVEEAYIHCRKRIPLMQKVELTRDWGVENGVRSNGADYFGTKAASRAMEAPASKLDEIELGLGVELARTWELLHDRVKNSMIA